MVILMDSEIEDVYIYPITTIPDERGMVVKLPHPEFIPEDVYCTTVRQGAIKAFHGYATKIIFWSCVKGLVKFVLIDTRPTSKTWDVIETFYLGENSMYSVSVPPGVYSGFKGVSQEDAIMVVQADEPYGQIWRKPIDFHGYDWTIDNG
jgi:dTDP-4-dehydrorhamnose 3,5-epimerase